MVLDFLAGPSWHDRAACAGIDPEVMTRALPGAELVCISCPVIRECAAQADEQGERSGVWGGVDRARCS